MSRNTQQLIRKAIEQLRDAGPDERLKILSRLRPHLKDMEYRRVEDRVESLNATDDQSQRRDRKPSEAMETMQELQKKKESEETQTALLLAAAFESSRPDDRSPFELNPEEDILQGPRPQSAV